PNPIRTASGARRDRMATPALPLAPGSALVRIQPSARAGASAALVCSSVARVSCTHTTSASVAASQASIPLPAAALIPLALIVETMVGTVRPYNAGQMYLPRTTRSRKGCLTMTSDTSRPSDPARPSRAAGTTRPRSADFAWRAEEFDAEPDPAADEPRPVKTPGKNTRGSDDQPVVIKTLHVGSGDPLLLLHGFMLSPHCWEQTATLLGSHCEVFAPALAGHWGGPEVTGEVVDIAALADEVERQLDEMGWRTCHIAGNSLGAWVGVELARRDRARTL